MSLDNNFYKTKHLDLSKLPDCTALSLRGSCNRLMITVCLGKNCPFKKTKEEEEESIQQSYQHLLHLDSSEQLKIAKKYYRGRMPWNSEK